MADEPEKPKPPERYSIPILDGLRIGREQREALARIGASLSAGHPFPGKGESAQASINRDLEAATVGGEDDKKPKRARSNRQGKSLLHGADRTVRFYKPTEAELDRLGELSKDEATARAYFGFCFGLVVNVVLGLVFATGMSPASKGVAFGIGICAAFAAYKFWSDAEKKRRDGKSALEVLKRDHDFTNI